MSSDELYWKLINGLSFSLFSGLSITIMHYSYNPIKYSKLMWNQSQIDYFYNSKIYLPYLIFAPLGFFVGYTQKPLVYHISPFLT